MSVAWKNVRAAATIGLLVWLGCASSACTSPTSPNALPFRPGTYLLEFRGGEDACPGMAAAGIDAVSTLVNVRWVDGAWHAFPQSSAAGDFVLTFLPGPVGAGGPGGGPGVTATPTGMVITTVAFFGSVADSRIVFGAVATLSGGLSFDGRIGSGVISGAVTFGNSAGVSVSCHSSAGAMPWMISWQSN